MIFYNIRLLNMIKEMKQVSIEKLSKDFGPTMKTEIGILKQLHAIEIENDTVIYVGEPDRQRL